MGIGQTPPRSAARSRSCAVSQIDMKQPHSRGIQALSRQPMPSTMPSCSDDAALSRRASHMSCQTPQTEGGTRWLRKEASAHFRENQMGQDIQGPFGSVASGGCGWSTLVARLPLHISIQPQPATWWQKVFSDPPMYITQQSTILTRSVVAFKERCIRHVALS